MRFVAIAASFLLLLTAACTFDDGDDTDSAIATAQFGQDLVIDLGYIRVRVPKETIGSATGQLPDGATVKVEQIEDFDQTRTFYSPSVRITAKDSNGDDLTGLAFNPPCEIELRYDFGALIDDGKTQDDLQFLRRDGTSTDELVRVDNLPATDSEFSIPALGQTLAFFTGFGDFAIADGGTGGGGGSNTSNAALTGTTQTVVSATLFQLADSGSTISATLAVPTGDTASPPTVVTLNDASFDAGNPLNPTNRQLIVQIGGTTYTTDAPGASVTAQIDTFTGSGSSGSMIGTMIEQGGSATLSINYTFTTGAASTALGGTVNNFGGRRTIVLTDATGDINATIVMPDSLPNGTLDPITFDDASFNSGNPLDANGRIVNITDNGTSYSSDDPAGNVTLTFTSFDAGTGNGLGSLTGTVVDGSSNTDAISFTIVTQGGAASGSGSISSGTPVDVTTTDDALESSVVFDGTDYVASWLADDGVNPLTVEVRTVTPTTYALGTQQSFTTTNAFDADAGFASAISATDVLCIVGATSDDPSTGSVIALLVNYSTPTTINEFVLGTGSAPRVDYNPQSDRFVVAWNTTSGVSANTVAGDGSAMGTTAAVLNSATLTGLASARGTTDEALVTADDGTGIIAAHVTPSTGAVGSAFDISTSLSGGVAAFDGVGGRYVVTRQITVASNFTAQEVVALDVGSSTVLNDTVTMVAANVPTQWTGGDQGVMLGEPNANFHMMDTTATGVTQGAGPLFGSTQGLDVDTTDDGPALANNASGEYVVVAARGTNGVQLIPVTVTP